MTLIERLRHYAAKQGHRHHVTRMDAVEAADLLEKQAARIKELEARLESVAEEGAIRGLLLVALRRKIDEAPVVAWKHHYEDYSKRIARAPDNVASFSVPLISKEDLQK